MNARNQSEAMRKNERRVSTPITHEADLLSYMNSISASPSHEQLDIDINRRIGSQAFSQTPLKRRGRKYLESNNRYSGTPTTSQVQSIDTGKQFNIGKWIWIFIILLIKEKAKFTWKTYPMSINTIYWSNNTFEFEKVSNRICLPFCFLKIF